MAMRMSSTEALRRVRHYSQKVRDDMPQPPLVKALAKTVDWEIEQEKQGKRLFHESAEIALKNYLGTQQGSHAFVDVSHLDEVSNRLEDSWKQVLKIISEKEPKHRWLQNNGNMVTKPDINTVISLIQEARKKLEEKHNSRIGKAGAWFRRLAETLDNHNYLFDMLPNGDKYTSVLVGAFTTLLKAAITYEKTAATISDCLNQLSDEVRFLYGAMRVRPESGYIKTQVAKFYCILFEFLVKILQDWYASPWKRLWKSFGDSLPRFAEDSMQKMRHYAEVADKELVLLTRADISKIGNLLQAHFVGIQVEANNSESKAIEFDQNGSNNLQPSTRQIEDHDESGGTENFDRPRWTSTSIREATEKLQIYAQHERTSKLIREARFLSVNREVYMRLHKWASCLTSEALWVEGPAGVSLPSQNTLTSAFMVSSLRRIQIPIMSYFCTYDIRQSQNFNRQEELLKLVYSLIYQISRVLPENLRAGGDFPGDLSATRFKCLTGEVASLHDAIELLADLFSVGPPLLFCIIDGLQLLDGQGDQGFRDYLNHFVEVVCGAAAARSQDKVRIVKIGISTNGPSWVLRDPVSTGGLKTVRFSTEEKDELLRLREVDVGGLVKESK